MESSKIETSKIVKKVILYLIFIFELYFILSLISGFVEKQSYFSLSPDFAIPLIILLSISLCTIAVISQTIKDKWEISLIPLIISISSFIFLSKYKLNEAFITSLFAFLYSLYGSQRTYIVRKDFIRIKIRFSERYITKSFLFVLSVITAISVFLVSENISEIDVGKTVADMTEKPIKEAIQKEYEKEVPQEISSLSLESLEKSNPQLVNILRSFGIEEIPTNIALPEGAADTATGKIKASISEQVNRFVDPYRKFFSPTLAILVFGLFQIYNSVSYLIYSNLINFIFLLLKKTQFIKIEKVQVEKDIVKI